MRITMHCVCKYYGYAGVGAGETVTRGVQRAATAGGRHIRNVIGEIGKTGWCLFNSDELEGVDP